MIPFDLARIEEAGLNAMQSQRQLFYDGWLLRVSPGVAKRGRSVNAHFGSSLPLAGKLAYCESVYARHGLPTLFRITPFVQPADLEAALAARGYEAFGETLVQAVALERPPALPEHDDAVVVEAPDTPAFVDAVGDLRDSTPPQREAHRERLMNSPLGKRYAVVRAGGTRRLHRADRGRRRACRRVRRDHRSRCAPAGVRDARVRVAAVLGVAARRARAPICR